MIYGWPPCSVGVHYQQLHYQIDDLLLIDVIRLLTPAERALILSKLPKYSSGIREHLHLQQLLYDAHPRVISDHLLGHAGEEYPVYFRTMGSSSF
jgi:hypothetical protein